VFRLDRNRTGDLPSDFVESVKLGDGGSEGIPRRSPLLITYAGTLDRSDAPALKWLMTPIKP